MLIVLLAALGVDLVVVVALLAVVLARRRWIDRQPGAFKGAILVSAGQVDGLDPEWRKGCGRWIRDILVWTKGPFHFRNVLVPGDGAIGRAPEGDEAKRLGRAPIVVEIAVGDSTVFVAARAEDRERVLGPYDGMSGRAAFDAPQHGQAG